MRKFYLTYQERAFKLAQMPTAWEITCTSQTIQVFDGK
jgi:hypothetical protein